MAASSAFMPIRWEQMHHRSESLLQILYTGPDWALLDMKCSY